MTASFASPTARQGRVDELQARIRGMQATKIDSRAVPTHEAFANVLPGGTLREGMVVQVSGSTSLLMALLATPSASGRWVAVSGLPDFGVEAAARAGIDLARLALVPDPGPQWVSVLAALADIIPVVAVRPMGRIAPAEASRLAGRLRQRGTTLLVDGDWPGSDARLEVESSTWHGLAAGHGVLSDREIVLATAGRGGFGRTDRARLRLPDADLGVSSIETPARPVAV